jgi:2-oxoglutarate dehydrogenase E1 component
VRRPRVTPLICFTPKSLLRSPLTRSTFGDLERGRFEAVLDDAAADPETVTRVVLATGKIAHEALTRRDERVAGGDPRAAAVSVVRVEQLYPWPDDALAAILARYAAATEVCWLQEEPENMGPWPFVHHQLHRALRPTHRLSHVARAESASPATGSALVHAAEQADLLERAIG